MRGRKGRTKQILKYIYIYIYIYIVVKLVVVRVTLEDMSDNVPKNMVH